MPLDLAVQLRQTVAREFPFLQAFDNERSLVKPAGPDSWSPRQELGHLIDSAANNHIRFVLAATQQDFHGPGYAQNAWVDIHTYQEMSWSAIVRFWYEYNYFLSALIHNIAVDKLSAKCHVGNGAPVSLGFLVADYILHMQHHIDHLLSREVVTVYPAAAEATP
jgi:hypothetical protein